MNGTLLRCKIGSSCLLISLAVDLDHTVASPDADYHGTGGGEGTHVALMLCCGIDTYSRSRSISGHHVHFATLLQSVHGGQKKASKQGPKAGNFELSESETLCLLWFGRPKVESG